MRTEIDGNHLKLNVFDLFENLGIDQLQGIVQSLACQDLIVRHVADQIIDGYTDDGFRAARTCGAQTVPNNALDIAIRRIAEASGEIAAKEIAGLKEALEDHKRRLREAYDEIDSLRRSRSSMFLVA